MKMKRKLSRQRPKAGSPSRRLAGQGAAAFLTRLQIDLTKPHPCDFVPVTDEQFVKCSSAIHKAASSSLSGDHQRGVVVEALAGKKPNWGCTDNLLQEFTPDLKRFGSSILHHGHLLKFGPRNWRTKSAAAVVGSRFSEKAQAASAWPVPGAHNRRIPRNTGELAAVLVFPFADTLSPEVSTR